MKMVFVNQFNRNFVIISFLTLLVLISSCGSNPRANLGDVKLTLKTMPDINIINEGKEFGILVEAENSGDFATPISVCISDTRSPGAIPEGEAMCINNNLEAANNNIPSKTKLSFGRQFVYDDVEVDSTSTIIASAEFDYSTEASADLCIRGEEIKASECKIGALKRTKGPIYISSINIQNEVLEELNDLNIIINIDEISDGIVLEDGVNFEVYLERSNAELECSAEDGSLDGSLLKWDESKTKKVINCITSQPINIGINDLYEDNLIVKLNYQYEVKVSKTLTIKNRAV